MTCVVMYFTQHKWQTSLVCEPLQFSETFGKVVSVSPQEMQLFFCFSVPWSNFNRWFDVAGSSSALRLADLLFDSVMVRSELLYFS